MTDNFWNNKYVLVTGGAGFLGSHLVELLVQKGAKVRVADNLENGHLNNLQNVKGKIDFLNVDLTKREYCDKACKDIEVVINVAAKVAGINFNKEHSGQMFFTNALLNLNMLEAARKAEVDRYLLTSTACVYPRLCTIPTPESEGFKEDPEPTNFGYGWSKRVAEVQAKCYAEEYGMKIAIVRPYNMYGPRDHFDPKLSHVIPALIKRVFDGENPLNVWGNGEQTRSFLYVKDSIRGILLATEKYAKADPINLGTDEEIKINDLVSLVVELSGKTPKPSIFFDVSKPSGQPRRNSDNTKAKTLIGYESKMKLRDGLKETIDWYKQNKTI